MNTGEVYLVDAFSLTGGRLALSGGATFTKDNTSFHVVRCVPYHYLWEDIHELGWTGDLTNVSNALMVTIVIISPGCLYVCCKQCEINYCIFITYAMTPTMMMTSFRLQEVKTKTLTER